jgi:hypothetical protein
MEIVVKTDENTNSLMKFDYNVILFGKNSQNKNSFIYDIVNGLKGKNKNVLVNGTSPKTNDYNVIVIDDDNDFENEFKFTKTNTLKKLIYDDVINKINEEKIINYTNEIFDIIDDKVNNLLDRKINKKTDNNISFQIEIPNINSIIDKFTNIYIDDVLLSNNNISKSMKRKLLYQLYFLDIKNSTDKTNFIIINNFDAYLNAIEIISLLDKINNISNEKCHFILSSCNNIFEYISLDYFTIYKMVNRLIPLYYIDKAIKEYILKREYKLNIDEMNYEDFCKYNEQLITEEEILNIKENILYKYPYILGKILNNENISFVNSKPKKIHSDYIICSNKDEKNLLQEILNIFID